MLCANAAIDVWSAGIVMCSLLARRNPLLYNAHGSSDLADLHSLTQVMVLVGVDSVLKAALACGELASHAAACPCYRVGVVRYALVGPLGHAPSG